jgi:hypothetical protein
MGEATVVEAVTEEVEVATEAVTEEVTAAEEAAMRPKESG